MSDYFPNKQFPDGYFPASYFGSGSSGLFVYAGSGGITLSGSGDTSFTSGVSQRPKPAHVYWFGGEKSRKKEEIPRPWFSDAEGGISIGGAARTFATLVEAKVFSFKPKLTPIEFSGEAETFALYPVRKQRKRDDEEIWLMLG